MTVEAGWWSGAAVALLLAALWTRRRRRAAATDDALAVAAAREGWGVRDDPDARAAVAAAVEALGPAQPVSVWTLATAVRHSREVRCFAWGWRHRGGRRGTLAVLPAVSLARVAARLGRAAPADDLPGRASPGATAPADHLRRTADPPFAAADVELVVGALRTGDDGAHVPAALRVGGAERAPENATRLVAALREAAAALPPHGRLRVATAGTTLFLGTSEDADVPWDVLMRAVEGLVRVIEDQSSGMP
ncbi:MAG: hypothetical protein KIT14_07665 [bacterium]|nr:hypothetical protein [bacterium]